MENQTIIIYTDGGCHGNPGPGGWAYVLIYQDQVFKGSGNQPNTTNNQMELTAVIQAFKKAAELDPTMTIPASITTDSQYVKNGINSWIHGWKRNGWKTASKAPVKNQELWMELDSLNQSRPNNWNWVHGHTGDPLNEACDTMVGLAIKEIE